MKFCPGCKTNKEFSAFYRNKSRKDGITQRCKLCVDKEHKDRWEKKRNRKNEILLDRQKRNVKLCSKCKIEKDLTKFSRDKYTKDGLCSVCKSCVFEKSKDNKETDRKRKREYSHEHRREIAISRKKRYHNDINYRISQNTRRRILLALQKGWKSAHTLELLGCSIEFLKEYLESLFITEMTWENYGTYWQIDHILPCASFDLSDEIQQKQCFHYTNLQPLDSSLNASKQDRLPDGSLGRSKRR